MNFWINSNSGDYISEQNGQYILHLPSRFVDGVYLPYQKIEITNSQFSNMKGFVPIKEKKLFSRKSGIGKISKYAPTLPDGKKGHSKRIEIPSVQDVRDQRLKELGL